MMLANLVEVVTTKDRCQHSDMLDDEQVPYSSDHVADHQHYYTVVFVVHRLRNGKELHILRFDKARPTWSSGCTKISKLFHSFGDSPGTCDERPP